MPKTLPDSELRFTRRRVLIASAAAPIWLLDPTELLAGSQPSAPPSGDEIVMTIVYDNNPGSEELTTDWGFSCLIQGFDKTILFDTGGDGNLLKQNMSRLGLNPESIKSITLSHIHVDHTGGLEAIISATSNLRVYVPAGFPDDFLERVRSHNCEPILSDKPVEIMPHVRTTGTLGEGRIEEHGLCVETGDGWVLITGCAHPGIHKMVKQAKEVIGQCPRFVFGGFHLGGRSEKVLKNIAKRLEDLGVHSVAPTHCSGDRTREIFKQCLGDRCQLVGVGHRFRFKASTDAA